MARTGLFLGIGEAGAGLSNAVQQYRENEARYREQKQREEMTAQQLKLAEAENEEAQERIQAGRVAAEQSQIRLQRDRQIRAMLPKYIQSAAPEDKQVIGSAVEIGDADPESALAIITKYYQAKAVAGWKQAQAIANGEIQFKKLQYTQGQENKRSEESHQASSDRQAAALKAANIRQEKSEQAAMQRAEYNQKSEAARASSKSSGTTQKMTQQAKNSLAGLNVLSGALDKLSNETSVLNSTYSRMKIAQVLKMGEKQGLLSSFSTISISKRLTKDEQDYVNAFNQARDSIQSLRTFSGNPRSNMLLYNSFITLLPDPLTTSDSEMAKAKINQLRKQIEEIKASLENQLVQQPKEYEFKDVLNAAR